MINEEKGWVLSYLNIQPNYSCKGQFKGQIKFQNGMSMEFNMTLDDVKCRKMVALLRDEVEQSAKELGNLMISSMPSQIEAPDTPSIGYLI